MTALTLPASLQRVIDSWVASPGTHPLLGDWRRVGYHRGADEPGSSGPGVSARSLGIAPNQPDDVSGALQTALDELGAQGGGILELDRGRYVLDKPLFIHGSNVVVKGAGKAETTLHFSRPLAESIRPGHFWSWTGGQIYFTSRERLAATADEQFLVGAAITSVSPAPRGADVLIVDSSDGITAGEMVLLEICDVDHLLVREIGGNVEGTFSYDWESSPQLDRPTWRWPVVVSEVVSSRQIRLEQPLRLTINRESAALIRPLGPTVHDSGVEGLTIENRLIPQTPHNENPGSNGVCFHAVHDCWATDIHVTNADVAFSMTAAKSCTLAGVSAGGRALHHFTISREGSHDNLIENFELHDFSVPLAEGAYTHGISVENMCSGNVWRRGVMHIGTFDSHRAMPFENLRTDIQLVNKVGVPGGAFEAGPCFGARFVHWGITVTTDTNLCIGITDVAPRSLTAGITGLSSDGSQLRRIPAIRSEPIFRGDLESESLEFGTDLGMARDLLAIQRSVLPSTIDRRQ